MSRGFGTDEYKHGGAGHCEFRSAVVAFERNLFNATITGDKTPETITLDEAIVLLDARAAQVGSSPKGRRAAGRKIGAAKAGASEAKSDSRAKKPAAAKPKKAAAKPKAKRAPKATAAE